MSPDRPAATDPVPRELCLRCLRPRRACWCPHLRPVESATRACILQHARERKTAIGTARMAHLSLPNSELHLGVSFRDHPRVRALAEEEGTALLFPGEGAVDPAALRGRPPKTVIVVDGTWQQARKLLKENPFLLTLPRIGLTPERPSNYRIRAEPSPQCVSTIEATVLLLGALEGAPERFTPILEAFDRMVDLQIAERDQRTGPPRRLRRKGQRPPRTDTNLATLRARPGDVVAVYAESNGWPTGADPAGEGELVQLVALRPSTGERFEAVVTPRRPLGPGVALLLELPEARFLAGEPLAEALARFEAFLRPGDLLCGWGPYAISLLRAAEAPLRDFADLRLACARSLGRRPGGVEQAVRLLGREELPPGAGEGRAGRRLGCLVEVLRRMVATR
ncbi:MAG TPA: DTW domain-containing protein [Anaeromyxobacteraceae bacterium]|nr:DTW domain-containing protein [Anaeromyxobacteraceae bacterium]